MKSVNWIIASLLVVIMGCSSSNNGWKDITPGKNLEGWTIVDVTKDGPLPEVPQWHIDETTGTLVCEGDKGLDWLRYDGKQYSDFIFHVEWRFKKIDGNPKYNSGVYVRNTAERDIWHQAQTGDASGGYLFGATLVNGEPGRVSTKDQMKDMENPVKPAGEWNVYDVTCKAHTISLQVNGVPTTVWENCEVLEGYVGLEAEGYYIEFRNIKIKEL